MGNNEWRSENEWPIANLRTVSYYFHSQGHANTLSGDGSISTVLPAKEPADNYTYDPADPAPFITEPSFAQLGGPDDYRTVEQRNDVLVYSTAPLTENTTVCGPIHIELHASSSAPDTDFTGKLLDVWENGFAQRLIDGIVRARFRESVNQEKLIEPNKIYLYPIDLWNTCQTFKKGHQIRVEISSSAFPKYDRNLNTGEPLGKTTTMKKALQKINHDSEHPSHISLPILP
jgi:hypothetical protein